jgi:hypothetical protein
VRGIYGIAIEAIEREHKVWGWMLDKYPESTLHRAVEVLEIFFELLKKLRGLLMNRKRSFSQKGPAVL